MTKAFTAPRFVSMSKADFTKTLNKRVERYFKDNGISKKGDWRMIIKFILVFAALFVPYAILLTDTFNSPLAVISLMTMMGVGQALIGLSIMHDANHGSLSKNRKINDFVSYSLNLIGGNSINWKIQHNFLHHSFTNVHGMDEDIQTIPILRFSPNEKRMGVHKLQFIYAWFFYGLMTLLWVTTKDISQLNRYEKKGLLKMQRTTFAKEMTIVIFSKIFYYVYTLVIPLLVLSTAWYWILLGWFAIHFASGLILSAIFQPAHVVPDVEFPKMNAEGNVENQWTIHQLATTMNYAPRSEVFSYFVGGLNFQVEHHLFPHICHQHYKAIAPIVKKTCEEFGIPYFSEKTFAGALYQHTRALFRYGRMA
jgi:linoleoyl-CoA desaturase